MSTDIEFNRTVLKLPYTNQHQDPLYLAMAETGNSSLREYDSNKIVRGWHIVAIGQQWHVMEQICKNAVICEGRTLRFKNNRHTKPENYIKTWRGLFKNPLLDSDRFYYAETVDVVSSMSYLLNHKSSNYLIKVIEELRTLGIKAECKRSMFSDDNESEYVWTFDISNQDGWVIFEKFAKIISPSPLQKLHVYGPTS